MKLPVGLTLALVLAGPAAAAEMPDLHGRDVQVSVQRGDGDKGPLAPVSMTPIGHDRFLISNYRSVYLFDTAAATMAPLKLSGGVAEWVPTAVAYSAYYDRVFIANYTGGNVVVARLTDDGLQATETISEQIKGPEGVAVSRGGRFMAVADYVGNELVVFERVNERWTYRWKAPAFEAHGIAIIDDHVFISGAQIAEFDIETGKQVQKADGDFLFVTCLNEDRSTGELIGSDTIAGRVFTMSPISLQIKSSFGANGPTHSNLSMPYCAYRDQQATWVLSTYQDRILRIDATGTTSFNLDAPHWQYVRDEPSFRNRADAWHGFSKYDSPSISLFGKQVRPSYGTINAGDGTVLTLPSREIGNWPFYVSSVAVNGDWVAIAANSSPVVMLINQTSGKFATADTGEWDCWAAAADILCPGRAYSVDYLVEHSRALDPDPAPDNPMQYLARAVGQPIPIVDYWRAWVAIRRTSMR